MTNNLGATPDDVLPAAVRGLRWLFFAALAGGITLPTALLIWQAITPNVVIQRAGAGRFVSASTSSALLQPSLTTVTTTQGSVTVAGLFSAPRSEPLEIVEWSQTSGLRLCAVGRYDTCLSLAGAWAGTLEPTAARAQVFNFQGHGLDRSNVGFWLFLGCALTFMTGAGWLGAHAQLQDEIRGSCEPPAIDVPDHSFDVLRGRAHAQRLSPLPDSHRSRPETRNPAAMTTAQGLASCTATVRGGAP